MVGRPMPFPPRDPMAGPAGPPIGGPPPMPPGAFPDMAPPPPSPEPGVEGAPPPGLDPATGSGPVDSQLFTDQQVSYHGPQEICGTCDFFQPPNGCLVVMGPKDESGWCMLHSARGGGAMGGTGGGAPPLMPPGEGEV